MHQPANKHVKSHTWIHTWMVLLLTVLLIVSLAFVATTFLLLTRDARFEQEWISLATEVQVSSQQLAKSAGEAASGNLEAFAELSATHSRISATINKLTNGSPGTGLPRAPLGVTDEMLRLNMTWNRMHANASSITGREKLLLSLADAKSEFSALFPDIQERTDRVIRQLTESGAPNQQLAAASRQMVLADRMLRRVSEILQGGSNAIGAAENLRAEIRQFDQVLTALVRGDQSLGISQVRNQQALNSLTQVGNLFRKARPQLEIILDSSSGLFEVRGAADEIFLDSRDVFNEAAELSGAVAKLPSSRDWPSLQSGVLGLIIMIGIVALLVGSVIAAERRRATVATSSNRHNQRAILKLLDELGSLADGDLTVQASVGNEFTGAIADAMNYAVEQLRELVMGINVTARSVARSAQNSRASTSQLAAAATHQAEQIDAAAETIKQMASSFDTMVERSSKSRDSAHRSVKIAHSGGEKVRETIAGMNNIREQIQESSKRIKRLGESTQEIGDIVSLINGIAEQTNVLALNAAIQAASAGGAGKGFAVVADEVQQLAESVTQATHRIESLVQTIQADTSEAVDSMESTTSEVVRGTRLAENAGTALVQIEKVSNELSGLIQEISREVQADSAAATQISQIMQKIRGISIQTSEGSKHTAGAVENLAELVLDLSDSVADFKLPKPD